MKTERILQELDVSRLSPVAVEIAEIVDEAAVLEVAALGQEVQVIRIGQTLNELEFDLKPDPLFLFVVAVHHPAAAGRRLLRHHLLLLERVLNHSGRGRFRRKKSWRRRKSVARADGCRAVAGHHRRLNGVRWAEPRVGWRGDARVWAHAAHPAGWRSSRHGRLILDEDN